MITVDKLTDEMVRMSVIRVTRTKVYPSMTHPGPAWTYVYTVAIPGELHTFSGKGLSWVRSLCKSKRPDLAIDYAWSWPGTVCPYGNMPRDAGAGHWRDWHRGHGCHLDDSIINAAARSEK